MPLFRQRKLDSEKESLDQYVKSYSARAVAPPEVLYPTIGYLLDVAFTFAGLAVEYRSSGGRGLEDADSHQSAWGRAVSEYQRRFDQLRKAEDAVATFRLSDSEPQLLAVQMGAELLARCLIQHHHCAALAFQAMLNGDKQTFDKNWALSKGYEQMANANKGKLSAAIRDLRDERHDQFAKLGISENNLIDLGFNDLED